MIPQRPVKSAARDARDVTAVPVGGTGSGSGSVDDLLNSMPTTPMTLPIKSEVPFDFEVSQSDQPPQPGVESAEKSSDPLTRLVREDNVNDDSIQPIDDSALEPAPRTRRAKLPTTEEQSHVIAASATSGDAPTISDVIDPESLPSVPIRPLLRPGTSLSSIGDESSHLNDSELDSEPELEPQNIQPLYDSTKTSGDSILRKASINASTDDAVNSATSTGSVGVIPPVTSQPMDTSETHTEIYTNSNALSTGSQVSVASDVEMGSLPSVPARPTRPNRSLVNVSATSGENGDIAATNEASSETEKQQELLVNSPAESENTNNSPEKLAGPTHSFEEPENITNSLENAEKSIQGLEKPGEDSVQSGSAGGSDSFKIPDTVPIGSIGSGASSPDKLDTTISETSKDMPLSESAELEPTGQKDSDHSADAVKTVDVMEPGQAEAQPLDNISHRTDPGDEALAILNKSETAADLQPAIESTRDEPTTTEAVSSEAGVDETKSPGQKSQHSTLEQSTKASEPAKGEAKEITPPPIVPRRPVSRGNSGLELPRVPTHRPQADLGPITVSKVLPSVPTRPVKGEAGSGKAAPSIPARPSKFTNFEPTNDAPPKLKPKPVINSKIGALRASLFSDLNSALARGAPPSRGVAGAGLGIPPAQGSSAGTTKDDEISEGNKEPEVAATDARKTRARGPRGRRLPTEAKSEWTFVVAEVWSLQSADEVISRNTSEAVQTSAGIENMEHHPSGEQTENLPEEESAPEAEIEDRNSSAEPVSTSKETAENTAKEKVVLPRLDTNYNLMSDMSLSTPVEVGLSQNDLDSNDTNNKSEEPDLANENEASFTILGDISAAPTPILQQKEWEA